MKPKSKSPRKSKAVPQGTITSVIKGELTKAGRQLWYVTSDSGTVALATSATSVEAMAEATELYKEALERLAKR